jgi:hypothetical protein
MDVQELLGLEEMVVAPASFAVAQPAVLTAAAVAAAVTMAVVVE